MELRTRLESWAKSRSDDEARTALAIARLFEASDRWSVARRVENSHDFNSRIGELPAEASVNAARILDCFLADFPTRQKRSASKDIHSLRTALSAAGGENRIGKTGESRSSFASDGRPMGKRAKSVNNELIDEYVRLLESVLREPDAFLRAYNRLAEDKRVRQPEAAMIARKFYGYAPASMAKKDALRLIKERHVSLEDHRAKSRAQAGKSAA